MAVILGMVCMILWLSTGNFCASDDEGMCKRLKDMYHMQARNTTTTTTKKLYTDLFARPCVDKIPVLRFEVCELQVLS